MLSPKKVFKEKKSIKQELENALLEKKPISYSIIAKNVGISIYRVRKYCKARNIDIENYNVEILKQKPVKKTQEDKPTKKKKAKKIVLEAPKSNRINLGTPNEIKFKLDNEEDE